MIKIFGSGASAWFDTLVQIDMDGQDTSPRKQETKEILNHCFGFRMDNPITIHPLRKLSYTFMAAEAFWILVGDNTVKGIAPYNKNIAYFSDDGVTYFGAYGPPYINQKNHIVNSLIADIDTRQAVLTIWIQNPGVSKDVPCTVSLTWNIRYDKRMQANVLNCHVFMRSSDVWLGLPYDMFNFSVLSIDILRTINGKVNNWTIKPGIVYMNLVSSHRYNKDLELSKTVMSYPNLLRAGKTIPSAVWTKDTDLLESSLIRCRELKDKHLYKDQWRIRPHD